VIPHAVEVLREERRLPLFDESPAATRLQPCFDLLQEARKRPRRQVFARYFLGLALERFG
jgi:hypothetical protein